MVTDKILALPQVLLKQLLLLLVLLLTMSAPTEVTVATDASPEAAVAAPGAVADAAASRAAKEAAIQALKDATPLTVEGSKRKQARLPSCIEDATYDELVAGFKLVDQTNPAKAAPPEQQGTLPVVKELRLAVRENSDADSDAAGADTFRTLHWTNIEQQFTLDQIRLLCGKMGCRSYSSLTKFLCCNCIAVKITRHHALQQSDIIETATRVQKKKNTNIRFANVICCEEVLPLIQTFNDKKDRVDHEERRTIKDTYVLITTLHNDTTPNDELDVIVDDLEADTEAHLDELVNNHFKSADIHNVLKFATSKETGDYLDLMIKVCCKIDELMTRSGNHEHDPMKYVDRAIAKIKGASTNMNRHGIFYAFCRFKQFPEILYKFRPTMPDNLKSSSTTGCSLGGSEKSSKGSKKSDSHVLADAITKIGDAMMNKKEEDEEVKRRKMNYKEALMCQQLLKDNSYSPNTKSLLNQKILDGLLGSKRKRSRSIPSAIEASGVTGDDDDSSTGSSVTDT